MKYLFILISLFSTQIQAQEILCYHGDKGTTREKNILPTDLVLDVKLIEKEGKVEGKATYKFSYLRKEIDTVFFDAIKFNVSKITINGESIIFRADSAGITMVLPKVRKDSINTLIIDYTCYPERGMYFLNWNNTDPKAYKQIWTQGQGVDNRHWIPGFDDVSNLLRMTTNITFSDKYPVVSNGNIVAAKLNPNKTKTWTYKMEYPHALYLTMIAAGDYKVKTQKSKGGITLEQYYYPDKENFWTATYQHSDSMMDWFENEIKIPYAWGKVYRNVPTQDFLFGAMENTTATIFADYMHQDSRGSLERAYLAVNAHELAHQWFGDLITERSTPHHWLHESFATHYSKKYIQSLKGSDEYDWLRKGERDAAFNAGKANSLPVAHTHSGSPRHYPKGSFVLEMLRDELGNENFRKSIAYYLTKYYHKNVETCDLISSIYEATGRDVHWFFDQWIYRGGEPEIDIKHKVKGKSLELITTQFHERDISVTTFRLPMTVSIYYKNGTKQYEQVTLNRDIDTFHIDLNQSLDVMMVLVDENMKFLRKVRYSDANYYQLIAINASVPMAKLEAIERLKYTKWNEKKSTFQKVFTKEISPLIRKEILEQITTSDTDNVTVELLAKGLLDAHVQVRRQAIKSMYLPNNMLKSILIQRLNDSSYVNIETAVLKLIELYPSEKATWLTAIKNKTGIMNNLSLVFHTQIITDKNFESEKLNSLNSLKYLASESGENRSRVPAINVLMENKIVDIDVALSMIQGALYFHPGIRATSIEFLKKIKKDYSSIYDVAIKSYPFSAPNNTLEKLEKRLR
jgi:aminopeptidase N